MNIRGKLRQFKINYEQTLLNSGNNVFSSLYFKAIEKLENKTKEKD